VSQLSVTECRLSVDPAIPPLVVVDPEATSEILSNLLDNARRHAAAVIEVRVTSGKERLIVEVTDDGPGLPSGAETQAFDRFVTLDGQGGTGLGLAIARELAQRQDGDLTYAGKTFVVNLPLRDAPAGQPAGLRPAPPRPADRSGPAPARPGPPRRPLAGGPLAVRSRGAPGGGTVRACGDRPAGRALVTSTVLAWALGGFAVPAQAATPTCFGQPATIVATNPHGEVITGTDGHDVIVGSPGPDTIYGRGGDDLICGMGGD